MSSVVSFKVRREIKEKMDRVNWAEELRRFVEDFSASSVREDCDSD